MKTLPREVCGDIEGGEKGGDTSLDSPVCEELRGDVNDDEAGDVLLTIADQDLCVGDRIASIVMEGE